MSIWVGMKTVFRYADFSVLSFGMLILNLNDAIPLYVFNKILSQSTVYTQQLNIICSFKTG